MMFSMCMTTDSWIIENVGGLKKVGSRTET